MSSFSLSEYFCFWMILFLTVLLLEFQIFLSGSYAFVIILKRIFLIFLLYSDLWSSCLDLSQRIDSNLPISDNLSLRSSFDHFQYHLNSEFPFNFPIFWILIISNHFSLIFEWIGFSFSVWSVFWSFYLSRFPVILLVWLE